MTIGGDYRIVLSRDEAEQFSHDVLRDVRPYDQTKLAIAKLVACWLSGEIKDEASYTI